MIVRVHGKPVTLTIETIAATRAWFIENEKACIAEAREYVATGGKSGTRVNNLDRYVAWCEDSIARIESGEGDRSVTFIQRAVALQTGECVPLLAPPTTQAHA
ncbi:hypothetical protein [Sphingomonas sp. ACRSK]|uniref:hypothetical protein n=1 Tax=Sphingomonas sp. ACRSK TaxID=2918213 RepID=UPI001EF4CCE1|nr:hypothetical protein [Sphingomonas sp. ACRSK]MCG7348846.1 hypothetical protein [Sphingomonas sp. ACRSK]